MSGEKSPVVSQGSNEEHNTHPCVSNFLRAGGNCKKKKKIDPSFEET